MGAVYLLVCVALLAMAVVLALSVCAGHLEDRWLFEASAKLPALVPH